MATSKIQVTEGSGKNLATNSFTEDAVTKEVSRVVVNDSTGAEVTVATAAKQDTGNSSLSTIATNTGNIPASPATTAKQDTGNTSLASIDGKITAVNTGAVTISAALPAGNNNIGDVDVASIAAGTNKIGDVDIAPRTTGGWSVGNFTSGDSFTALTSTAQVCKASAGKFGGYYVYNPNAVVSYVIVYDVAQGSVTVGTTNPKLVFAIPAYSAANLELIAGIPFSTAITVAATTTGGGNTAPTTALECMIWYV